MNSQEFCYWLQGLFELTETKTLSAQQVEIVKNHLQLVFTKVTDDVVINNNVSAPIVTYTLEEFLQDFDMNDTEITGDKLPEDPPTGIPDWYPVQSRHFC